MINTKAYMNQMVFPRREDFTEKVVATSRLGETKEVKFFDQQGYNKARSAYFAENTRLLELFVADLKEDLGITDHPKAGLLISKALNNFSGDFYSIAEWCEDMVDLIL